MPDVFDWLSRQPNWIWLLAVALVTHRLSLRRERWNREQARRIEQRKAIVEFSAAVTSAAPAAGELATWLERRRAANNDMEFDEANNKCDEGISKFADKIFDIHRAADFLKMSLVDPELAYRGSFALKLALDICELGGDRRRDPTAKEFSLTLLERRCTDRMKQLLIANDALINEAMVRIPPQTSWLFRRVSSAHFKSKSNELSDFANSIDRETSVIASETVGDIERPDFSTRGSPVETRQPWGGAQCDIEEREARIVGGTTGLGRVRITRVVGRDLDRSHLGRFIGRHKGGYNQLGRLTDLIPVVTEPRGMWRVTVDWGDTPTDGSSTENLQIPFDQVVEFVELDLDESRDGESQN